MPTLEWTGDAAADELISRDFLALGIGFVLDQQILIEKAFWAPLALRDRMGGKLDAKKIAATPPHRLQQLFTQEPKLHRFPVMMGKRVQGMCAVIADEYGNKVENIWKDAVDAKEVCSRLAELPGIGPNKAKVIIGVLGRRFGITPKGWETWLPDHPTLADVATVKERSAYQANKREVKRKLRAAAKTKS